MLYRVTFSEFTTRHYIKTFAKKYKSAWDFTLSLLQKEFEQIDLLFLKSAGEIIVEKNNIQICKTEFKIAGTDISRHASGNRCIVAVNTIEQTVCVLLIYHKNDLEGDNETQEWKKIVKANYPEYKNILS